MVVPNFTGDEITTAPTATRKKKKRVKRLLSATHQEGPQDPYGFFVDVLRKQHKVAAKPLPKNVAASLPQLNNVIKLPDNFIEGIIEKIGVNATEISKHFLESSATMHLGNHLGSQFSLVTMRDGLRVNDAVISGDIEYLLQWIMLQSMCIKFIELAGVPKIHQRWLTRQWLSYLTEKAVSTMRSSIHVPAPTSLDRSDMAGVPIKSTKAPPQRVPKSIKATRIGSRVGIKLTRN